MLHFYRKLKKKFTTKQWDILRLVNPYGPNMSLTQVCRELQISRDTAKDRIKCINKKCPNAWNTIQHIKHAMRKEKDRIQKLDQGRKIKGSVLNPYSLDASDLYEEDCGYLTPYDTGGVHCQRGRHGIAFDPFKAVL